MTNITKKLLLGITISTTILTLGACSTDKQENNTNNDNQAGKIGESSNTFDSLPSGLNIKQPTNDNEALKTMCAIKDWWLQPATAENDRKQVSGLLLDLSKDYSNAKNSYTKDVAKSAEGLAKSGYTVTPNEYNAGQLMMIRACPQKAK